MRWIIGLLCLSAVAVYVMAMGTPASADDSPYSPPVGPRAPSRSPLPGPKHPKFAASVLHLVEAAQSIPAGVPLTADSIPYSHPDVEAAVDAGLLRLDNQERVQVYMSVSGGTGDVQKELQSLGIVVERQSESAGLVQATVPIKTLPRVAELDFVTSITPPNYGHVNIGSKLTEGVGLLGLNAMPPAWTAPGLP